MFLPQTAFEAKQNMHVRLCTGSSILARVTVHLMQLLVSQNLMWFLEFLACIFSYRTRNLEIMGRISVTRDWTLRRSYQHSGGQNISLMPVLKLRVTAILCEVTFCLLLLKKHEHVCSRYFNLLSHTQVLIIVAYPWLRVVRVGLISGNKPGHRKWEE